MESSGDAFLGTVLAARYRVLARIGAGGMGVVYRAWDHASDHYVVVKAPLQALLADDRSVARFDREMEAMRRMRHPAAVPVTDFGSHAGVPYAVMPYLAGGSLARRRPVRRGRPAPAVTAELHHWLGPIADALDHLHAEGFVHRDVKPDNILFNGRGRPFLGDFGIATFIRRANDVEGETAGSRPTVHGLTATGHAIGTPEYMAPELIAGCAVDGRADQYALGAVIHELLAGRPPFVAETPAATLAAHLSESPCHLGAIRPELPRSLCWAVRRSLAKHPADRFTTCRELAAFILMEVKPGPPLEPRLICPACGRMMTPPAGMEGRNGRCPSCREVLFVTADLDAVVVPAERLVAGAGGVAATGWRC